MIRALLLLPMLLALVTIAVADETPPGPAAAPDAEEGYRLMVEKAFVPSSLDQALFDRLWEIWPEHLRAKAEAASADERRAMAYARYGFTPRPDDPTKPLQYVVDKEGNWTMNCLACHGGAIEDKVVPGLPNNRIALQTLADDVFQFKLKNKIPFGPYDLGSRVIPMGTTVGTTNAVVFSVTLLQFRDKDLNVIPRRGDIQLNHHDLDAPPWWHYKKRPHIYIDGLAPKGHRSLMQFMLVPQNGRDKVLAAEPDFEHIAAFIEQVEAPKYDGPVDAELAKRGRAIFEKQCADCHGTYGENPTYPSRLVPIDKIGTDRLRLDAITKSQRETFADSWFTYHDPSKAKSEAVGYIAPPLDGIWASAPYFHNGSVPTLWHVLNPDERPVVWRRTSEALDREKMGMSIEPFEAMPEGKRTPAETRLFFDTTKSGKSAAGHTYPNRLSPDQRRAVLEYLKTL